MVKSRLFWPTRPSQKSPANLSRRFLGEDCPCYRVLKKVREKGNSIFPGSKLSVKGSRRKASLLFWKAPPARRARSSIRHRFRDRMENKKELWPASRILRSLKVKIRHLSTLPDLPGWLRLRQMYCIMLEMY